MIQSVWLIPMLPLLGVIINLFFGEMLPRKLSAWLATLLVGIGALLSAGIIFEITGHPDFHGETISLYRWITVGDFSVNIAFYVDQLSALMLMVVTGVGFLIHMYSIGYMDHDKSFNRFFAWLSAFVFSMMILVMSDNFAGLFIGWEGVGLCSWGLIGFWYHKEDKAKSKDVYTSPYSTLSPYSSISPSYAANEAFIMNRVADLGMLVGIFLIYWNLGSLQYDVVFANVGNLSHGIIISIAVFLFIGAMGKSAQFPFNQWLANAMEGPTPVSALIHAATMVTAGVYMVARFGFLYNEIPSVGEFIAIIGITATVTSAIG